MRYSDMQDLQLLKHSTHEIARAGNKYLKSKWNAGVKQSLLEYPVGETFCNVSWLILIDFKGCLKYSINVLEPRDVSTPTTYPLKPKMECCDAQNSGNQSTCSSQIKPPVPRRSSGGTQTPWDPPRSLTPRSFQRSPVFNWFRQYYGGCLLLKPLPLPVVSREYSAEW